MKDRKLLFGIVVLTVAVLFRAGAQDPFTNGLVAYYPFNGNANDASGNGNNGTVNGPALATDRFGQAVRCYHFDGVNDYILLQNVLPDSTVLTISAWIDYESGSFGGRGDIFNDSTTASGNDFQFAVISINRLGIVADKSGSSLAQEIPLSKNIQSNWTHVVWVMTSTQQVVYVDGVVAAATNQGGQNVGFHGQPVIGASNSQNPLFAFFGGKMDDIRIYNRALSDSEVAQLNSYESGPQVGLIKAVKPSFSKLAPGAKYQLQASLDLNTWYDQGLPFTATSTNMVSPWYYDVDSWEQLFFRLQVSP